MQYIDDQASESNKRKRDNTDEGDQTNRFTAKDRQWDARFTSVNTDTDEAIVNAAKQAYDNGRLRYILIGGPEIGTNPKHDDYGLRHVHLCIVASNPLARSTILSMFGIKRNYYLAARNRTLPISGWREHHTKEITKVDPATRLLYEAGELPADTKKVFTLRSQEEKSKKGDEVILEIYNLIKKGTTEDEIFQRFPRNWMMYGEKIKSMVVQRKDFFKTNGDPHIWLYGSAGTGKSSLLAYVYPRAYSKCLYNRFFDLYKPTEHTHVLLEDLDHAAVETLSLNFIKTLCDESGFTYDQKYKAAQPARTTVLVSSQFDIRNILDHLENQIETNEQFKALTRRFFQVKATELHRLLGIKLRNNYELSMLKKEGTTDPGACFMPWNYLEDMPGIHKLPSPEECQQKIRDAYYGVTV